MATQRVELQVEERQTGKNISRGLRDSKKIPAVIYGALKSNLNVCVDENTMVKYSTRAYENALFNVKLTGGGNIVAMVKAIQVHPVTRRPEHVDFLAIDLTKAIRIMLELKFEGKPAGIADGGLLNIVNRQIEIEVLPTAIPDAIVVDVSGLGVGDSIHVSELTLPAGVKLMSSGDTTLAVVALPEEEAAAPTAEAGAAAAATPAAGAAAAAPAAAGAKDAKAAAPAAAGKDAKAAPAAAPKAKK